VFVSAGRYTNYLLIAWVLMLAFTGYLLLRHRRGRNLAFISLAVVYAAVLLSGSRGVFLWTAGEALFIVAAYLWGAPWRQREVIRVFRTVQRAALAIGLAVVALFFVFPDALFARLAIYSETLTPGSSASELQSRTWDYPLRNFLGAFNYDRWPYGFGIGTSSLGVQYVAKIFHGAPMGVGVESGFGALVVEMGIGGLILWLVMSIAILVSAWKIVKKLKGTPWFPIAFAIFLYAFVLLLPITFTSMVAYEDFVINAYFWTLLGILFRLPSLALSTQFANVPAPAANPRLRPR
jgi:O-antigen ligase